MRCVGNIVKPRVRDLLRQHGAAAAAAAVCIAQISLISSLLPLFLFLRDLEKVFPVVSFVIYEDKLDVY